MPHGDGVAYMWPVEGSGCGMGGRMAVPSAKMKVEFM
jgi:hypothetical protein